MKTWLVNTNSREDISAFKYMIRQNRAIAYGDKAVSVDKIKKGDLVCLYHNDNRIIAVGAVIADHEGHDYEDIRELERWVDANWLWKARFDDDFEPIDSINRHDLSITMVNGTVVNVTEQMDYKALMTEIAKRQNF